MNTIIIYLIVMCTVTKCPLYCYPPPPPFHDLSISYMVHFYSEHSKPFMPHSPELGFSNLNLGSRFLPKDTLVHRLEQPRIELPTFPLLHDLLYFLGYSCSISVLLVLVVLSQVKSVFYIANSSAAQQVK